MISASLKSALKSLTRALTAHHPATIAHSLRVRDHALLFARRLSLSKVECHRLVIAARWHDLGKIGLPEAILNKTSTLTVQDLNLIRQHPSIGERILRPIIRNRQILQAIRHHHERFDGAGYPDGLYGSLIPLFARIISVVDSYDAMTSARTYQAARDPETACISLESGAGAQFDPDLVRGFVAMMRAHRKQEIRPPQFVLSEWNKSPLSNLG